AGGVEVDAVEVEEHARLLDDEDCRAQLEDAVEGRRVERRQRPIVDHGDMLTEIGDGAWAYVQRDGGWGWSNAGLVADGGASLLVDTLFDLRLTADMLAAM